MIIKNCKNTKKLWLSLKYLKEYINVDDPKDTRLAALPTFIQFKTGQKKSKWSIFSNLEKIKANEMLRNCLINVKTKTNLPNLCH